MVGVYCELIVYLVGVSGWTPCSSIYAHYPCVLFVYVIAWLGVKFGINFTSVVVRMAKIARGEAECNLPFSLQHK